MNKISYIFEKNKIKSMKSILKVKNRKIFVPRLKAIKILQNSLIY